MPNRFRTRSADRAILALAVLTLAVAATPSQLSADGDHDRARQAVRSGRVLPLHAILDALEKDFAGQVLDVELEDDDGAVVYEIELLAPGGRKIELVYDARTGRLLSASGPGVEAARRPEARR